MGTGAHPSVALTSPSTGRKANERERQAALKVAEEVIARMGHSPRTQVGAGGEGRPGAGTGNVTPSLSLLHPCPGRWKSCPRAARRPSSSSSSPAGSEGAGAHGASTQPRASPGLCRLCQLPADACALLSHPPCPCFCPSYSCHSHPRAIPMPTPFTSLCRPQAHAISIPVPPLCHPQSFAHPMPVSSPSPCPCPPHAHVIPFSMPMPSQACAMCTITLCQHRLPPLAAAVPLPPAHPHHLAGNAHTTPMPMLCHLCAP